MSYETQAGVSWGMAAKMALMIRVSLAACNDVDRNNCFMAPNDGNDPAEPQVPPEREGNGPPPAELGNSTAEPQLPAPGDEPRGGGEPEPKTSNSAEQSRSDKRSTVIITAFAGIIGAAIGALIGAVSSYIVAQSNNTHEADETQVTRRLTIYADFLTAEADYLNAAARLNAYFGGSVPTDMADISNAYGQVSDKAEKEATAGYQVSLIDSRPVDRELDKIAKQNVTIASMANELYGEMLHVFEITPRDIPGFKIQLDAAKLKDFQSQLDHATDLQSDFIHTAKADMAPPNRGLFS